MPFQQPFPRPWASTVSRRSAGKRSWGVTSRATSSAAWVRCCRSRSVNRPIRSRSGGDGDGDTNSRFADFPPKCHPRSEVRDSRRVRPRQPLQRLEARGLVEGAQGEGPGEGEDVVPATADDGQPPRGARRAVG